MIFASVRSKDILIHNIKVVEPRMLLFSSFEYLVHLDEEIRSLFRI